jgi:hypothetical protein
MSGVPYASREAVMSALDVKASAYTAGDVDRAILSGSSNVEALCHRRFYPLLTTKYWEYPNPQEQASRLYFDDNEFITVTSFTSGGSVVPPAGYYLEPANSGPPYSWLEINRGSNYALTAGPLTAQRSLALTGLAGYDLNEEPSGTLTAAVVSASATTVQVSGATPGVGSLLRVDTERMQVTEKSFVTSAQTGSLTANLNANTLTVADGTAFTLRETLLIDAERLLVVDIAGNNLIVKRAQGGSVLAAHTTATVFYARQLTVQRGALGTTAATHLISAPVVRHVYPYLVEELAMAYAISRLLGESAGYAREIGQGGSERSGTIRRDISDIAAECYAAHGRMVRFRTV